ncbi:ABC transporter ATP-binding protein [Streptomyces sp. TRM66268-LWL]|uniref:ABC transporter ATP-binding protein n=1 Tax=Streptomyces polyasparticus TaxID=2767826 RepID=A0ABR7SX23_9ACTN|nr:ATP-binding cassette domain-containing protein [Streptomyces polyasparticus]MBC9718873.1 ABC transporter ATP-binding protein [Streptomyces polyasparticus]
MLELDHVVRRFGDRCAVDHVSFRVDDGRMTGFVGGNGAGKTTTMRMIMGVLALTDGEIRWNGAPATSQARRGFGYMPEERGLYPKQPVLNQLVYLGRLRGLSAQAAHRSATDLIERLALADKRDERLEALSLGNQQRVQIAAALIGEPQLLVLDEPFSGLDPHAVDSMAQLLREHTARGIPVLFSSHQLELVERLCDDLVIQAAGRVLATGTAESLRRRGRVRHRLVGHGDMTWLHGVDGVRVISAAPGTALLELATDDVADRLLTQALSRGPVREFAEIVPSVADVFREMTAA